jgi:hypothetical protein
MKSTITAEGEEIVTTEEDMGQEKEEIIDNVIQEMQDF